MARPCGMPGGQAYRTGGVSALEAAVLRSSFTGHRRGRLRREIAAVTVREYALQDVDTLEATRTMLNSSGGLTPGGVPLLGTDT
jgi:hypothetical protein